MNLNVLLAKYRSRYLILQELEDHKSSLFCTPHIDHLKTVALVGASSVSKAHLLSNRLVTTLTTSILVEMLMSLKYTATLQTQVCVFLPILLHTWRAGTRNPILFIHNRYHAPCWRWSYQNEPDVPAEVLFSPRSFETTQTRENFLQHSLVIHLSRLYIKSSLGVLFSKSGSRINSWGTGPLLTKLNVEHLRLINLLREGKTEQVAPITLMKPPLRVSNCSLCILFDIIDSIYLLSTTACHGSKSEELRKGARFTSQWRAILKALSLRMASSTRKLSGQTRMGRKFMVFNTSWGGRIWQDLVLPGAGKMMQKLELLLFIFPPPCLAPQKQPVSR